LNFGRQSKLESWDQFGARYWELAAKTSHPSPEEIGLFLAGVTDGSQILVIGATTREVIAEAIGRGARVTVVDFAPRLLDKLKSALPSERLTAVLHDIADAPPKALRSRFEVVVSDRLINRFHRSEMPGVCAHMGLMAMPGGQVRMAARLGLYPLDRELIEEGRKRGTLRNFWDEASLTIDWSHVGEELDACATSHGEIPREVVIAWSRQRGVESRVNDEDMRRLIRSTVVDDKPLVLESVADMEVAPSTKLYTSVRPSR
jgi:hypothetical protein